MPRSHEAELFILFKEQNMLAVCDAYRKTFVHCFLHIPAHQQQGMPLYNCASLYIKPSGTKVSTDITVCSEAG